MIQQIRKWNEAHALFMLFAAGLAIGLETLLPVVLISLLSFSILFVTGFKSIAHLRPFGGVANWVTFGRMLLLLFVLWKVQALQPEVFAALAFVIIVADGIDGYLARKLSQETEFGGVFDMEVDALFGAGFAILIYQQFEIGAWILVAGLLRYGFVFLVIGLGWRDKHKVQMKESKTIAVLFFLALLTPFVAPVEWAWWCLLITSILIVYSFTKEIVLLARQ